MFDALPPASFYLVAIPAVILVGLAKGGMGDAFSLLGVPLLSLAVTPVQAAGIMLPILVVMDLFSLWVWRKYSDWKTVAIMMPGGLLGVGVGWLTYAYVPGSLTRIVIGLIAVLFAGRYFWQRLTGFDPASKPPREHSGPLAALFGTLAGFGSFVAHSGGPPYQIYTLPLKRDPKVYTGTSVRFFAILNAVKLVPYFILGELDASNLKTSISLFIFAPFAIFAGAMVVRRMKPVVFYPVMYAMALISGAKLLIDGVMALH